MSGDSCIPGACLGDRLGIRGWPAIAYWVLAFPAVALFAALGGQWEVFLAQFYVNLAGAGVLGIILFLNFWYYPRLERVINDPQTIVKDLAGTPVGPVSWLWTAAGDSPPRGPSDQSRHGDILALGIWIPYTVSSILFEWQSGTYFTFGPDRAPLSLPWGILLWVSINIAWGFLTLAAFSLLFHYAGRWKLLRNWVKNTDPGEVPRIDDVDDNVDVWEEWEAQWRVYCQGLQATSIIFFKGYAVLIFALAALNWVWAAQTIQGASLHPAFILSFAVLIVALPLIYLRGPSWSAWRKIQEIQTKLRETATGTLFISRGAMRNPRGRIRLPPLIGLILAWSNESHLSLRHGDPVATLLLVVAWVAETLLFAALAVVGLGFLRP